jgi:alpha-1,2-mannosyltransferase
VEGIDRFEVAAPEVSAPAGDVVGDVVRDVSVVEGVTGAAIVAESPRHHGWHPHAWHGPGMVRRAVHGGRRAPLASVLAVAVIVAVVGPMLWARLYAHADFRMVDLAVYRSAGQSLLQGRPLYGYLTPVPQLLPFTYPPFSAVVALLLAAMPAQAANWVWTLGTLAVLGWLVMVGFRPFVRRFPTMYRPLVVACVLAAMAWVEPVRDCFRYGQVGIFLAALCVLDCASPKTRWPRGMLVGFAAAVKLVPGVFIPYLWFTGRRRAAVVATAWFAGFSIATAIAMPSASKVYWTSALFDSNRLGSNSGASNQSIRGIFLRWLPGNIGSALWVISVIVIAVAGYRWARSASFAGHEVRGIAIVGLLSVLISPVSWIHHLAGWVPLAIGVLLGDGRNWRRVAAAVIATVFFSLQLPWWGAAIVDTFPHLHLPGRLLEDSFALGALFAVWLLGRTDAPSRVRTSASPRAQHVRR